MNGVSSEMAAKLELYTLLKMPDEDLKSLLFDIVRSTAIKAVLPRFRGGMGDGDINYKPNSDIVTAADTDMQQRIIEALQTYWPNVPVLGEEQSRGMQLSIFNANNQPFWVLDPIDGTSNFAFGIPYFCTSLALIYEGKVWLGLVYDPVRDECFYAASGSGATLNGITMDCTELKAPANLKSSMALVDFKRLPNGMASNLAAEPPYRSQRSFGASALDWCWIAANRCQIYLHGDQKLWDYTAGSLILQEAGGISSTFHGSDIFDNTMNSKTVIAATHPTLFKQWHEYLDPFLPRPAIKEHDSVVRYFDPG
ncbi:inositol monophosphatase [Grimontia sp. AD028]|uniref:inositol monophosphatase family protein n=1 Tax=Grimontia sp. AD028 TaxID=1581149 RepID=UPI0009E5F0EF|nr:inositol monophosphatase [Grimontia sp. AD028]